MKLNPANSRRGMTKIEVMVIIVVVAILAALLFPSIVQARNKARFIRCNNYLKQINLALKTWAVDHKDNYPMMLSATNGGAMEFAESGNPFPIFKLMSNELATPFILVCPADKKAIAAASFDPGLKNQNISYFISLDANDSFPAAPMIGDDNLAIAGIPVSSGLLILSSNAPIEWTKERHNQQGNIGLADGSVQQYTSARFRASLSPTGLATNRLVIP